MPESVIRTRGRGQGYKFDRGGMPAEFGPFIGTVKNNIDPIRAGRLQVYIEQFSGGDEDDESLWRTVSYIPPFYGMTPQDGTNTGVGTYPGNPQSYGMWFTPPDLGVRVICFFVEGDPNQGYYIGCVPDPGVNHMLPAIGASQNFELGNSGQDSYFARATQLPVTEINTENVAISEDPRFFDQDKPVQSVVAGIMMQQGLITDNIRGPITSNAQRESPSAVFGISTPGRAIYQGGLSDQDIATQLNNNQIRPQDVRVIGRRGGHSIVLDDGDLEGQDNLLRIRTAKGHQITMSDDGDCFYIIHANGQTWLEFGKQGTVDVFSTNSVNIRTQGTINLHADKDINMFAGGSFNVKSNLLKLQAEATLDLISNNMLTAYGKNTVGIRSDGSLALKSNTGSWDGGSSLGLEAGCINLNGGGAQPVSKPASIVERKLADVAFETGTGWVAQYGKLDTIVTRAPTHEPYPYHNEGVESVANLDATGSSPLLGSVATVLGALSGLPVANPLTTAAFLEMAPATLGVGSLNIPQVTGLMASAGLNVDQAFDVISDTKGIGKFGFSAAQLEAGGFLKPGTVQTFLQNPADLTSVLSSPSVWTGKEGVSTLSNLLGNPELQNVTQNSLMAGALDGLRDIGIVTGSEDPKALGTLVQVATKYGVKSTSDWVQGKAPANLVTQITNLAKDAEYAVSLVDTRLNDQVNTGLTLGGFTNTTNRTSIDQALSSVIGNPKIPVPDFSGGLYTGVPDSALTYEGDDPIIIERINAERARRGLAPLGGIRI